MNEYMVNSLPWFLNFYSWNLNAAVMIQAVIRHRSKVLRRTLPLRAVRPLTHQRHNRLNVATQNAAHRTENTIQAARKFTHSSRGREGNQRKNQEIFHQSLAFLLTM